MGGEIELFDTCLGGSGLPVPRLVRGALGRRAGRVQAAGRRRHDPRRPGRVLLGDRGGRRRGPLDPPRDPPPRAGLRRPARHPGVAGPPAAPRVRSAPASAGEQRPERPERRDHPHRREARCSGRAAPARGRPPGAPPAGRTMARMLPTAMAAAEGEHEVGEDVGAAEHGAEATGARLGPAHLTDRESPGRTTRQVLRPETTQGGRRARSIGPRDRR